MRSVHIYLVPVAAPEKIIRAAIFLIMIKATHYRYIKQDNCINLLLADSLIQQYLFVHWMTAHNRNISPPVT